MNLAPLKSELTTDPAGLGYAAPLAAGAHGVLADLLNKQDRAGKLRAVDGRALRRAIVAAWATLDADSRALATFMAAAGFDLDAANADDAALIAVLTGAKAATLTDGLVSRAEELGLGVVSHEDVSAALGIK